jgi:hypothetical protein
MRARTWPESAELLLDLDLLDHALHYVRRTSLAILDEADQGVRAGLLEFDVGHLLSPPSMTA